jgi:molecular chaperone DnaK
LIETQELMSEADKLAPDDVTDDKFKLENRKRELAERLFQLTSSKRLDKARADYRAACADATKAVKENGNDREQHQLSDLLARETTLLETSNPEKLEVAAAEFENLAYQVRSRQPSFQVRMFKYLVDQQPSMNDQLQAKNLLEAGRQHVRQERWDELGAVNGRLFDLLPDREAAEEDFRMHTGIV